MDVLPSQKVLLYSLQLWGSQQAGRTFFNVGGEGQYAFTQGDGGRLYTLLGAGYYYTTSDDSTKDGK